MFRFLSLVEMKCYSKSIIPMLSETSKQNEGEVLQTNIDKQTKQDTNFITLIACLYVNMQTPKAQQSTIEFSDSKSQKLPVARNPPQCLLFCLHLALLPLLLLNSGLTHPFLIMIRKTARLVFWDITQLSFPSLLTGIPLLTPPKHDQK